MKKEFIYIALSVVGAFVISGCTASSSPGVDNLKRYNPNFVVDSDDRVNVSVTKDANVTMQSYEQDRIAQKIEAKINELKVKNPSDNRADSYNLLVKIKKYNKGSAFARFMMAGLGSMVIESHNSVTNATTGQKEAEFDVNKVFAWGGIYGGTTTIEDVEEGFAKGVAEAVTKK